MAPQCTSCRCSPWPLLYIGLNWAGQNQLFKGTTTLVSLPTMEDPILQEPSRVLLHQCQRGAFIHVGGLDWPGCESRTGSCCCSCTSAISVGEARWSGPLELPQCRWNSVVRSPSNCLSARQLRYTVPSASWQLLYTVCRCLQTAPLHCLLVGCDSSTSNPARSTSFVGEHGGELREAGWKHGWRVTSQRLL